jgi:hypothetical protein
MIKKFEKFTESDPYGEEDWDYKDIPLGHHNIKMLEDVDMALYTYVWDYDDRLIERYTGEFKKMNKGEEYNISWKEKVKI